MSFADAYGAAFHDYLRGSGERALETAYELGRRAIEEQISILDLAEIHHAALAAALEVPADRDQLSRMARAGTAFLTESLSAYEMLQRGFREVQQVALLEQQYADQLRDLAEGSTALNSTFSIEEILRLMGELAPRIIGAGKSMVAVPDPDSGHLEIAAHPAWNPAISAALLMAFEGNAGRFRAPNGEEVLVGTVRGADGVQATIILAEKEEGPFTERDEAVLAKLSQTCSIAIERAGLYERQRGIAETLQRALLPDRLPRVPGLSLATRYLPGGAGANVGGDWYDLVVLPDQQVGLALGDVMGRGIRAATVMGQVRIAFRAYAMEHRGPREVLDLMTALLTSLDPEHFSTLVYVTLEVPGGRAVMAQAGHPPPLLITAEGETRLLTDSDSPPLCAVANGSHPVSKFEMAPGDTLVLYTDGLIGRRDLTAGMSRIREVAANSRGDHESLCDRILENMPLDSDDDVALLAARLD
ncbi:MAG: SpoIIE family protein phosphatase [Actinobacteria bacterium]|nr:SpoIIE family protein phosphatase [Actinomycetota bacterium]